jgi:hypothetical protein
MQKDFSRQSNSPTSGHTNFQLPLYPAGLQFSGSIHRSAMILERSMADFQKNHAIIQNPKYPRLLKLLLGALAYILDAVYFECWGDWLMYL